MAPATRLEKDSMGEMEVPAGAYYGAQTARAVLNFPVSGQRMPRAFVRALGLVKLAAARTNGALGTLEIERAQAIESAAREVMEGSLDDQFVVDVYQTGSGTSTNMNANEVIARRAWEILAERGRPDLEVHPNDHVNMGQSSNDVIPTCIHLAAMVALEERLLPALGRLREVLEDKARELDDVVKTGRTHLQDAVPVRLGQELGGHASMVAHGIRRLEGCRPHLLEVPLGGTAVGTGLNAHPELARRALEVIEQVTGLGFVEPEDRFEAQGARDAAVELSSALRNVAVSLTKIANDVRWLGSGPRFGLGEITLPAVQPGSSIMPGKVNPVMAESLIQVAARVVGNDATAALCGMGGNFELNTMMPLLAHVLLESVELLAAGSRLFADRCVAGIEPRRNKLEADLPKSLALVTRLAPIVGYEQASGIAKEALETDRTVLEVCLERRLLPEAELERLLDPRAMTGAR